MTSKGRLLFLARNSHLLFVLNSILFVFPQPRQKSYSYFSSEPSRGKQIADGRGGEELTWFRRSRRELI